MSRNVDLELLLTLARNAQTHAYAPYSGFRVGAAVVSESGPVHVGCNVENAAYPATTCAEASAIASMIVAGGTRIAAIMIVGDGVKLVTPCGNCRQIIREFANADTAIHIAGPQGVRASFTLEDLLPESFGPENVASSKHGD